MDVQGVQSLEMAAMESDSLDPLSQAVPHHLYNMVSANET
jgi:hypothetical protein